MKNKSTLVFSIVIIILGLLSGYFYQNNLELKSQLKHTGISNIPDTIIKKIPYKVIEIKEKSIPYEVVKYVYRDTTLRQQMEDTNLIAGVRIENYRGIFGFKKPRIIVDKITPQGIIFSDKYHYDVFSNTKINYLGEVEITRKKRRLFLKIGLPIIGVAAIATGTYFYLKTN